MDLLTDVNWLFIAVLAILGGGMIFGLIKGFASTIYSLLATVLIIVLTIVLCPIVANALRQNENLYNGLYERIDDLVDLEKAYENLLKQKGVEDVDAGAGTVENVNLSSEQQNNMMDEILQNIGLPEAIRNAVTSSDGIKDYVAQSADGFARSKVSAMEPAVVAALTNTIINAIGFLVTFICVALVVGIIGKVLDLVTKIPGIKQLNTILGGVAGLFEGLLVVWLLFTVITALGSSEFGQSMLALINENPLLSFIYENNFISAKLLGMLS